MAADSSNGEQSEASNEDQSTLSAILSEGGTSLHDSDLKDEGERYYCKRRGRKLSFMRRTSLTRRTTTW